MPAKARSAAGAAALLLLAGAPASAGQITLQVTSTAQLRGDVLAVDLIVVNSGDEPAFALRPSLALHERELSGASRESLAPGASFETSLALALPGLGAGRWPFRLAVDYADAQQHPFQALQLATIDRGASGAPGVEIVAIEAEPLSGRGAVTIRVRNSGASMRQVALALVAPRDLEAEVLRGGVALQAGETQAARFALYSRTAIPGSRYPVFTVVEYDEAGVHHALVREAAVSVLERRARLAPFLLSASGALLAAWGVALLLRRRLRAPV
jgi:hypothetical protein